MKWSVLFVAFFLLLCSIQNQASATPVFLDKTLDESISESSWGDRLVWKLAVRKAHKKTSKAERKVGKKEVEDKSGIVALGLILVRVLLSFGFIPVIMNLSPLFGGVVLAVVGSKKRKRRVKLIIAIILSVALIAYCSFLFMLLFR